MFCAVRRICFCIIAGQQLLLLHFAPHAVGLRHDLDRGDENSKKRKKLLPENLLKKKLWKQGDAEEREQSVASLLQRRFLKAKSLDGCCSPPPPPPSTPEVEGDESGGGQTGGAPSHHAQSGAAPSHHAQKRAPAPSPSSPAAPPKWTGGKPHWFYKSSFMCTASDQPGEGKTEPVKKCPTDAAWKKYSKKTGCDPKYKFPQDCSNKKACPEMAKDTMEKGKKDPKYSNGGFGFMCPHLMLGSAELLAAAKGDDLDPSKHAYGVATIDALKCGQCAELENLQKELKYAPKLTVQIFNSDASVVDVYMAGGGNGAFNGCSKSNKAVKTGPRENAGYFYEEYVATEKFKNHLKNLKNAKQLSDDFDQLNLELATAWGGGLRGGRSYADCMKACKLATPRQCRGKCQLKASAILGGGSGEENKYPGCGCSGKSEICITDSKSCEFAFKGHSDYVTRKAIESCKWAFDHDLHWNRMIKYKVVPCPKSLVALTGLKPLKLNQGTDAGFPKGIGFEKATYTTTMEDCSAPTCSRQQNNHPPPDAKNKKRPKWEPGYDAMYACNAMGEKMVEGYEPKNPC